MNRRKARESGLWLMATVDLGADVPSLRRAGWIARRSLCQAICLSCTSAKGDERIRACPRTHETRRSMQDERRMSRRHSTGRRCCERYRTRLRPDARSCNEQRSPGSGCPGFGNGSNGGAARTNLEVARRRARRFQRRSGPTFSSLQISACVDPFLRWRQQGARLPRVNSTNLVAWLSRRGRIKARRGNSTTSNSAC